MYNGLKVNRILIKDESGNFRLADVSRIGGKEAQDEGQKQGVAGAGDTGGPAGVGGPTHADGSAGAGGPVKPVRTTLNLSTDKPKSKGGVWPASSLVGEDKSVADFYFSIEDEEEVKGLKKDKHVLTRQQLFNIICAYAQAVIDKSMLTLDAGLKKRLLRIIESRLRDIRDLIETKEALVRSRDLGGIGLDEQQTSQMIKLIEQERAEIEELVEKAKSFKELPEVLSAAPKTVKQDDNVPPPYKAPVGGEVDEKQKEVVQKRPVSLPEVADKRQVPAGEVGPQVKKPIDAKRPQRTSRRIMGPVDELRATTLKEFRSLGDRPQDSKAKIVQKLDVLERESVDERAKGLAAWRESPVYKLYLDIGQASMMAKKSVEQYIRELDDEGETLTFEEFEVIADLNKQLSF